MLSKKQKIIMTVLGSVGLLFGLIVAIPFRSFPGLNKIDNILTVELVLKLIIGLGSIGLGVYPLIIKYRFLSAYRENSKIAIFTAYFPILCYMVGANVNIIYELSYNASDILAVSSKALGIIIAVLTVYLVFTIYCIVRIHEFMIRLDRIGNIIADIFIPVISVCFMITLFAVNRNYNFLYAGYDDYFVGNPILFFIYILLVIGVGLAIKYLVYVIRKDETLIFYSSTLTFRNLVRRMEYCHAYNDVLDDYENYYDAYYDDFQGLKFTEVDEFPDEDVKPVEPVKYVEIQVDETVDDVQYVDEEIDDTVVAESEQLREVNQKKEEVKAVIDDKNKELAIIRQKKNELEQAEEELRQAKANYDDAYQEYLKFKEDYAPSDTEVEEPKKKVKKLTPAFDKVVEYANELGNGEGMEGFKVNANAKGNLLKYYIGKKMFLVLQSTNNDYRVSFISNQDSFVEHVTTHPGEVTVPKNLKDNNWLRMVNKNKLETKYVKQVIKEAADTAKKQIQEENERKIAERKAKAAERRAAKKAAAQAEAKPENPDDSGSTGNE